MSEFLPVPKIHHLLLHSMALLGVLVSVSLFCCHVSTPYITLTFLPSFVSPCGRRTSTHRPFCRLLFFPLCVISYFMVCPIQTPRWNLSTTYHSMILFDSPIVIPTRMLEVVLLFLHTIFSALGQVCHPAPASSSHRLNLVYLTHKGTSGDRSSI
jgi:hypothetical protein